MVKYVKIVIGAAFGDEGKGNTVDRFSGLSTLVVRFNGGAQASHTVEAHGKRHAFSHFGSGSFKGAATLLGPQFIINPTVFRMESAELAAKGIKPIVYADRQCRVTTIYDMMYNQFLEQQRGENRHGSCGLGINATVDRHEVVPLFLGSTDVDEKLDLIRQYYNEKTNCLFAVPDEFIAAWKVEYDNASELIRSDVNIESYDSVVFEGAQGLMLDEFNGKFPHVTRSRTGTTNLYENPVFLSIINQCDDVEVLYITRSYATRHGRGPFWDNAEIVHQHFHVDDKTNIPNPWQETLRLAPLNFDELAQFIMQDCAQHSGKLNIHCYTLVVTCVDQLIGTHAPVYDNERPDKYSVIDYGELLYRLKHFTSKTLMFDRLLTVHGHRKFEIETLEEDVA